MAGTSISIRFFVMCRAEYCHSFSSKFFSAQFRNRRGLDRGEIRRLCGIAQRRYSKLDNDGKIYKRCRTKPLVGWRWHEWHLMVKLTVRRSIVPTLPMVYTMNWVFSKHTKSIGTGVCTANFDSLFIWIEPIKSAWNFLATGVKTTRPPFEKKKNS